MGSYRRLHLEGVNSIRGQVALIADYNGNCPLYFHVSINFPLIGLRSGVNDSTELALMVTWMNRAEWNDSPPEKYPS